MARPPKLSYPKLRRIDDWYIARNWSSRVMARMLRVSRNTVYDAALRRRGYRECGRG